MSYGFRILSAAGGVMVDSDYPNYMIKQSGSFVLSVPQYQVQSATYSFTTPVTSQEPPLLGLKWTANDRIFYHGAAFAGGPGNWTGFAVVFSGESGTTNITVDWRVYCTGMAATSGYALQTRNAAGVVCFDSSFTPIQLTAVVDRASWSLVSSAMLIANTRRCYYQRSHPSPGSYILVSLIQMSEFAQAGLFGNPELCWVTHVFGIGGGGSTLRRRTHILNTVTTLPPVPTVPFGSAVLLGI